VTLTGKPLVFALLGSALAGVAAGSFASGWSRARGLPVVATADAGVSVSVDAGASSKADCSAVVDHWSTIYVPGPTRYIPAPDGGQVLTQPQVVAVLVPELRLGGSVAASAASGVEASAEAGASLAVVPVAPEKHWEAGPAALYGFTSRDVFIGGVAGWSAGPFGVRVEVLKGPGDVYAGAALVWRW
jgi:hypothetical protein